MKCTAELHIADDHGDNEATIRCQLEMGHEGPHKEEFDRGGSVVITFVCDESSRKSKRLQTLRLIEQGGNPNESRRT